MKYKSDDDFYIRLDFLIGNLRQHIQLLNMITLITVQCSKDTDSQGRGLKSLLGTADGNLLGTLKDSAVHSTTIKGTP